MLGRPQGEQWPGVWPEGVCAGGGKGLKVNSVICHTAEMDMACPTLLWWWHVEEKVSKWGGCRNEG